MQNRTYFVKDNYRGLGYGINVKSSMADEWVQFYKMLSIIM